MHFWRRTRKKRPQSATVVLRALESIGVTRLAEGRLKKPPPQRNPIYRKVVFVGREAELKQLQSAFDSAMSGRGTDDGTRRTRIGKTALCEQLATWVTLRGGRTLVGHCYEEGSLSLPYLAFVEAMRSYVLTRDTKDLRTSGYWCRRRRPYCLRDKGTTQGEAAGPERPRRRKIPSDAGSYYFSDQRRLYAAFADCTGRPS